MHAQPCSLVGLVAGRAKNWSALGGAFSQFESRSRSVSIMLRLGFYAGDRLDVGGLNRLHEEELAEITPEPATITLDSINRFCCFFAGLVHEFSAAFVFEW